MSFIDGFFTVKNSFDENLSSPEKRGNPRFEMNSQALCGEPGTNHYRLDSLDDISRSGLRFSPGKPHFPGKRLEFLIPFSSEGKSITLEIKGRVVWMKGNILQTGESIWKIGCSFEGVGPNNSRKLDTLLREKKQAG